MKPTISPTIRISSGTKMTFHCRAMMVLVSSRARARTVQESWIRMLIEHNLSLNLCFNLKALGTHGDADLHSILNPFLCLLHSYASSYSEKCVLEIGNSTLLVFIKRNSSIVIDSNI